MKIDRARIGTEKVNTLTDTNKQPTPDADDRPVTQADLREMVRAAIQEFRAPTAKEQTKAQQLERFRKMQRAMTLEQQALKEASQRQCKHLRIDNTSCIGWMQNSDGIFRGVCQHCNKLFVPEMGDEYERARAISTLSPLQIAAQAAVETASRERK